MGVVIDQLEQVAPVGERPSRGPESDAGVGRGAPAAPVDRHLMQLLRREAARQARLWAD